jgi:hypothetical protein
VIRSKYSLTRQLYWVALVKACTAYGVVLASSRGSHD